MGVSECLPSEACSKIPPKVSLQLITSRQPSSGRLSRLITKEWSSGRCQVFRNAAACTMILSPFAGITLSALRRRHSPNACQMPAKSQDWGPNVRTCGLRFASRPSGPFRKTEDLLGLAIDNLWLRRMLYAYPPDSARIISSLYLAAHAHVEILIV